ncbi:all trans-polyprenyl-diphosphate synthase PDSS2-like [Cydia pomonella]|uniref:all trans-polyprenyl-diphosphate synthase PDSS2-like n=1 Tax=Cydia pomonella TaxID=82600 RepID=UPI002ADD4FCA|nr:all trans-polyprenyl-diphosphate synthase PDSS2-like [Cydia pomonella]XP_061710535.1 all trans-polyprenyl-diphosphate synthase PDSS2-like [Cydia pomonella]
MAEILELQSACHIMHKAIANLQEKEKFGDKYHDLLNGNKVVLLAGDYILSKSYLRHGGLRNTEVSELIFSCLRDQIEGKFLGERGIDDKPIPSKPKVTQEVRRYDWENECNLEKLGSNDYLGQGKEEWILRTMLLSGSILGKGCEAAMKLARRGEIERDAYKFGGHFALLSQLYLNISDFFTNPKSNYSLVSAPVIMALWEYPSVYDQLMMSQRPVNLNELNHAVSSTRCMDALSSLLNEELSAVVKCSDRMPIHDAREALQNIARALYGEAMKIIEKNINKR